MVIVFLGSSCGLEHLLHYAASWRPCGASSSPQFINCSTLWCLRISLPRRPHSFLGCFPIATIRATRLGKILSRASIFPNYYPLYVIIRRRDLVHFGHLDPSNYMGLLFQRNLFSQNIRIVNYSALGRWYATVAVSLHNLASRKFFSPVNATKAIFPIVCWGKNIPTRRWYAE